MTDADLEEAGKAAVAEGLRLWHLDVGDPAAQFLVDAHPAATPQWLELHERALRWRGVIDEIYTAAGWGAVTPYKGNNVGDAAQWCGFFAAACWRAAGIDPKWLAPFFASTSRLHAWAHYQPFNQHKNDSSPKSGDPRRLVAQLGVNATAKDLPFIPRQGDIAVIGKPTDRPELHVVGRHITVVRGVDLSRNVVLTCEGNGWGSGPNGGAGHEGIVINERHIGGVGDRVMWIYRPSPTDLQEVLG